MLPTKKNQPTFEFEKEKILLYGDWKVGKTQLASHLSENALFLATEKGQSKAAAYIQPCETWLDFMAATKEVKASDKFSFIVVDTIDALWYKYLAYFCETNNIDYEGDLKWGKGHALMVRGFINQFQVVE